VGGGRLMALTLIDISDLLRRQDCVTILELLDISEDELVDRFMDKIEEKADFLERELNEF
jgi:hypothetical protein